MKIVMQKDYPALGFTGDIIVVKRGYARNFLLPRGYAVEASSRNAKVLQHNLAGIMARKNRLKMEAQKRADEIGKTQIEFTLKIGQAGKSFGSVSVKDIHDELTRKGIIVDRRQISLPEPIKAGGNHQVNIRLHSEVLASFFVNVTVERAAAPVVEEGEEGEDTRKKSSRSRRKTEEQAEQE